jgi:hypothetical protein
MRSMFVCIAALASGCSFGLGDTVTFVARNLEVDGQLADGAFASTEGDIAVLARSQDATEGVDIRLTGTDGARSVAGTFVFSGDLGALCPGSYVELREDRGQLVPVDVGGPGRLDELSDLRLDALLVAGAEDLRPDHLWLTSASGTDGFSVMSFMSTTTIDGVDRTIQGTFEVARVAESTDAPGWEGETWEGQPIENWE